MIKDVNNWLKQAKADSRASENSFKSKDYNVCVFYANRQLRKHLKHYY